MRDADFEGLRAQVARLQDQADHRAKDWRRLWRLSLGATILFAVMALAFVGATVWFDAKSFPTTHQFVQIMSFQFMFLSVPLILLTQALRAP